MQNHRGEPNHRHCDYKNSLYNICIEWENGETTYEPLAKVIVDDPITMVLYAKENNLLNITGWMLHHSCHTTSTEDGKSHPNGRI